MVNGKPTFISLFAGCGGSSLGYKWAGYRELLAIDFDKNAVETFKLNFSDIPCWQRDIREVTGKEILDFCKIEKGELFLLDASPPCQGFSTAGKRKVSDPRNDLFKEFVRFIKELDPKVFVMENVSGLVKGKMKGRFIEIMTELKALPYQVKCKLMNTMYYDVPQSRQRLIWIGTKNGFGNEIIFPIPKKTVKAKETLEGLPVDGSRTLNDLGLRIWGKCSPGQNFAKYHPKGHWFNAKKLNPDKPAMTIEKMVMEMGAAGTFHWEYPRVLNIGELKRLSTFPDGFKFKGKFKEQWAVIGNSVPPKFMEVIARQIRATVEHG